jgi:hypothetical protein
MCARDPTQAASLGNRIMVLPGARQTLLEIRLRSREISGAETLTDALLNFFGFLCAPPTGIRRIRPDG